MAFRPPTQLNNHRTAFNQHTSIGQISPLSLPLVVPHIALLTTLMCFIAAIAAAIFYCRHRR